MTRFEIVRYLAQPFLPVLYHRVRRDLRRLLRQVDDPLPRILDVGARKSPYTVGLRAAVDVLDIPPQNDVMVELNLGFSSSALEHLRENRSNIRNVFLMDMIDCSLESNIYDVVVCVEVIEHVQPDREFVSQLHRVLKPGGFCYLTTPNGDYIKNEPPHYNPDHVRHYKRAELESLLRAEFLEVDVHYGVRTGRPYRRGLPSIKPKKPINALGTMLSNVVNHAQSVGSGGSSRTAHLFATCTK